MNREEAAMMRRRVKRVLWDVKLSFLWWGFRDCGGGDSTMVEKETRDDQSFILFLRCA